MIETKRALLRRPTTEDLARIRMLESDPEVVRWTPMRTPPSIETSRQRLANQIAANTGEEFFGFWLAENKFDGSFIGWFMIVELQPHSPSLGYMLVQDQWAKGWATEIDSAIIEMVFQNTKSHEILATVDSANIRSQRVLEKLGFEMTGTEQQFDAKMENQIVAKKYRLKKQKYVR